MAAPKIDPQVLAHLEWLGFVQPTGLVVSAPALVRAGALLDRRDTEGQALLRSLVEERTFSPGEGASPCVPDFRRFAEQVLGWSFSPAGYAGTDESPIPSELVVALPAEGDLLRPDFAVREREPVEGRPPWQLLVQVLESGQSFDRVAATSGGLEASPHGRLERLLRQTKVSAGLLFNGRTIRLLSAPYGESSGWLDFHVADMVQVAGRPISTALRLLLSQTRLLALPKSQRLAALLADSRKYQNEVSERLAEQVLHALYELLRGFQAAHDASKGHLLGELLREQPDSIYRGLLTVLLRLVFLLYAEEREMLPDDDVFDQHYSLAGLYDRLREDAALYPDTMDQRYGAWAQLLVLFRMVHDGANAGSLKLPRRHGVLFDPDQYKFLEGRPEGGARQKGERLEAPLVSDGTIFRALEKLLVLDGERISYRALDVEEIGSVYQTMMGFRLETAFGRSIAIKAGKKFGAPTTIDLDALAAESGKGREKWLQERADRKLSDKVKKAVAEAESIDDLHAALLQVVDRDATPDLVPPGAMVLQPSEERRRSGSHYTPRSLTEPIVRTTLEPILARLKGPVGQPPRPEQILDLKVCDPAMGSGAFLVEACRQLAEALIESWRAHGGRPKIPPDEDEVLFARRLVAQRCLYGVDRNPVAVDLAKVSLWLATLARDHAFTFLDHSLRHGDSLVGLSRRQLESFHWDEGKPPVLKGLGIRDALDKVSDLRRRIREVGEGIEDWEQRQLWEEAGHELARVRLLADLAVAAFFEADAPRAREALRQEYVAAALGGNAGACSSIPEERRSSVEHLVPFHWEIEFPEIFERSNPGLDAVVGNPPFLGGKLIAPSLGDRYAAFLKATFLESKGAADLCAYFFRRMFVFLRGHGAMGLIATNTIAQADTREVGLDWLVRNGGGIFCATTRLVWPGLANVHVAVVHLLKGAVGGAVLDGRAVVGITTQLFAGASQARARPQVLAANFPRASGGTGLLGIGFVIDSATYEEWMRDDPSYSEVLRPYVNGKELNSRVDDTPLRYVIDFGDRTEVEAAQFSRAIARVRELVKPEREKLTRQIHERCYWKHWDKRSELYAALAGRERVLVCAFVSKHLPFDFLPTQWVYSKELVVIPTDDAYDFATLQSTLHSFWARKQSGTLKSDLSYSISDALRTFPLPLGDKAAIRALGAEYLSARKVAREALGAGLTDIYNRFHSPECHEPVVTCLRSLHASMDRAVLDAYGWIDIPTDCEFLLDYEIDEEEWGNRKKPWRYRWPDEVRDEVLARLLELNAQRAAEEARSGAGKKEPKKGAKPSQKRTKAAAQGSGSLFP